MKTLIIIPTYNEIENIEKIIEATFHNAPNVDILIIDDNSADGTGKYVEKLSKKNPKVHIIHREGKLGLGSAYRAGFRYSLKKGYDYTFEMDADFSHNPKDIPKFLEKIKTCDLVVGSRYLDQISVVNWPLARLILSYSANFYARIITGTPTRDLTSGFKCYSRKVLEGIPLDRICSDGYGFQIETVFWAYHKNFNVQEMLIVFTDRIKGISKMSKTIVWEAFWLVWKLRAIKLFHT